jgi:hypothetical protein
MGVTKVATARWLLVMAILWPFGCSMIQPAGQEKIPPTTPGSGTIKQAPDSEPQQASPQDLHPLPSPAVRYFNHKIKWPGENLILIARWYTGSAKNWMRLVEANPGIEPRRIMIGETILIPEDLLQTDRPMPIEFLSSATDKKKEPSPPPAKQAVKSDKIELFGPIDTETQKRGADDSDSPLPLETIE